MSTPKHFADRKAAILLAETPLSKRRHIVAGRVLSAVCDAFLVDPDDVCGPGKHPERSAARAACWTILVEDFHFSVEAAGVLIGNRNHVTVHYALKRAGSRDQAWREDVAEAREQLRQQFQEVAI